VIRVIPLAGLLLYSLWMIRRAAHARQVKSSSDSAAVRIVPAADLEADPPRSPAAGVSWTVDDERQLIRLLTDSAP